MVKRGTEKEGIKGKETRKVSEKRDGKKENERNEEKKLR